MENTISSAERHSIINRLFGLNNIKDGLVQICKYIKERERVDLVGIYEVKMSTVYALSAEDIPSQQPIDRDILKSLMQKAKTRPVETFQLRLLGQSSSSTFPEVHSYLKAAFESEYGIHYLNTTSTSTFNRGVFMPFLTSEPSFITKLKQSPRKNGGESCARFEGFVICALNNSAGRTFSQQKLSRIFDQIRIIREIYSS